MKKKIQTSFTINYLKAKNFAKISGVLYLNTDEKSSKLYFYNPNLLIVNHNYDFLNSSNFEYFSIVPKNNDLIFDLSDTSLVGLDLKLFYDPQLTKEFTSVSTDGSFNLIGIGTVGVSSTSNLTLKYSNTLPEKLYYGVEKLGVVISPDDEVKNYSEIVFVIQHIILME